MTNPKVTRRQFAARLATAGGLTLISRRARAADFEMSQYHNQPTNSPMHRRMVEMWSAINTETAGRVETQIFPGRISATDASPPGGGGTQRLRDGEIDFLVTSASGLGRVAPAVQVQSTPFVFRTQAQVYEAMDGDLGDYIRAELRPLGLHALPGGCFENGFHQITTANTLIRTPADMEGLRLRAPGAPLYLETFETMGAVITSMNLTRVHAALESDVIEAQSDPLNIVQLFKFYEVQKYVNMLNHSWSGFNMLASLQTWERLPEDVREVIERNVRRFAALQRADNAALNGPQGRARLIQLGMEFVDPDTAPFKAALSDFYPRWKASIGQRATSLLEAHVGPIG